ncbi:hypothetical protein COOONC_27580 [Cooperia oncophora]
MDHITPQEETLSFTSEEIVTAAPAAGHLSSSSLHPVCQTPYLLLTSCDDEKIRFWRCTQSIQGPYSKQKYEWAEWNMINDNRPRTIFAVAAARSGRIACAYDPARGCLETWNTSVVEIGVFECESSGGAEWLREDTFAVEHLHTPNTYLLVHVEM